MEVSAFDQFSGLKSLMLTIFALTNPPTSISTSSPMGNDRSPGSQCNVWKDHNL